MPTYHGSPVAGLQQVYPSPSPVLHGEAAVFGTPNRTAAALFSQRWSNDDFQFGAYGNRYYLKEMYKGAFRRKLAGKSGSVYTVSGLFRKDSRLPSFERVSSEPVKVLREERVDDILQMLKASPIHLRKYQQAVTSAPIVEQ